MSYESYKTPFENGSYAHHCHELFDADTEWQDYDQGPNDYQRWVWRKREYVDYPNKYVAAEFAVNLSYDEDPYLVHAMYFISSMSMEDDDYGLRKMNQWFISQDAFSLQEEINHMVMTLNPDLIDEKTKQKDIESVKFAMTSGLAVPNEIDLLELGWSLDMLKHGKLNPN